MKPLFVHIPKTAGKSVRAALRNMDGLIDIGHSNLGNYARNQKRLGIAVQAEDYFTICFVRNPFARLRSAFYHLQEINDQDRGAITKDIIQKRTELMKTYGTNFRAFVMERGFEKFDISHFYPQAQWYQDKSGTRCVNFIGYFETLQDDFSALAKHLGYPTLTVPHRNKTVTKAYIDGKDGWSREMVDICYDFYRIDFDYLGYGRDPEQAAPVRKVPPVMSWEQMSKPPSDPVPENVPPQAAAEPLAPNKTGNNVEAVTYEISGMTRHAHATWYRGENCVFAPNKAALMAKGGLEKYILEGWIPDSPIITKETSICTFGSCFAANVARYLKMRGYNVLTANSRFGGNNMSYIIRCGEGMVNAPVIRQQFEWALENKKFDEDLWFDNDKTLAEYDEAIRAQTAQIFNQSEFFILTFGLSETWYNKRSGEAFWRAIPQHLYDESKHGFKLLEPEENFQNIERIYQLIRKHLGTQVKLLMTLSPIPLVATFRPVSCITANSFSKASLRCALDRMMRTYGQDKNLFYFPSFEIVKDYFHNPYEGDNRHVRPEVIQTIMGTFEKSFCDSYHEGAEREFSLETQKKA